MIWSFLAIFFSAWLYVDASYRGSQWQRWVFKPVTLLMLLALAWQSPLLNNTDYLILAGLVATLLGDALLLLPERRILYALGAFFLSHLFYTLFLASQMTLSFFWPLPLVLLVIGVVLIALIWSQVDEFRWPACTFIGVTLLMTWLGAELYFSRPTDYNFTLMAGTILLLLATAIRFINLYRYHFKAAQALVAACYFSGHFMIVRSLWLQA